MGENRTDFEGIDFNATDDGIRYPSPGGFMKATKENTGSEFTADKDYFDKTEDGRRIQVLAEGVTVPMAEAIALGVVKPAQKATPENEPEAEKAATPPANKSKAPAANKSKGEAKNGD